MPCLSYAQDPVIKAQDVVITEIMADPSPAAGLPELEWIELRNRSDSDINLLGWKLAKPSSISGPMPDYLLKADSLVLICSRTSLPDLLPFGSVLSVTSFSFLIQFGRQDHAVVLPGPDGYIQSVTRTIGTVTS